MSARPGRHANDAAGPERHRHERDPQAEAVGQPEHCTAKRGGLATADFGAGELPGPLDTITVVGSKNVANGAFDNVRVDCTAGRQALGGGLDTGNVFTAVVTSSYPVIDGNARLFFTANGERPAATGWVGWVRNDSGAAVTLKVAVICGG